MQYEEIIALLPDYLDNRLSKSQQHKIDKALSESEEVRQALANIAELKSQWQEESPPDWHRTAFLARARQKPTQWMNWISLATSVAAICLVLFRVEVVSSPDGLHIGFGQPTTAVAYKKQLKGIVQDWSIEQQAYVTNQLLTFENQQLRRDQKLMATVLELNKEQRRQDLQTLTNYLVKQRKQDLLLTQNQYQTLYEIQDQDREDIQRLYASLND